MRRQKQPFPVLVAPNQKMARIMRKMYPTIKVYVSKKLPVAPNKSDGAGK